MSINFPAIDLIGEEPIMAVHTPWGIYRDKGGPLALDSVSGLDAVLTIGGSGATTSINITVQDPDGIAKAILDTDDIHMQWCEVWQEFEDTVDKVKLFEGQINAPISWDSASRKISFTLVSKVESQEIGFSVEDKEVVTGDTVASDETGRAPSELIGKAWPLCFGSVLQSPTLKFTWVEDTDAEDDEDADANDDGKSDNGLIENINGKDTWLPLDIPSIKEYIKAIRACGTLKIGEGSIISQLLVDPKPNRIWLKTNLYSKLTGTSEQNANGILSNAKAWDTLGKLQIEFETKRQGNLQLKQRLFDAAFQENFLYDEFKRLHSKLRKAEAANNILTPVDYADANINGSTSAELLDQLIDTAWDERVKVKLLKGHGLRNPTVLGEPDRMSVNINGQKFSSFITGSEDITNFKPNELQLVEPLPVCEAIPFNETRTAYSPTVKITKNAKLKGMYAKVTGTGKYLGEQVTSIVYITDQEVVTTEKPIGWDEEANGAFQPTYLYSWVSYQPIMFFVSSVDSFRQEPNGNFRLAYRTYFGEADIFASGVFEEAAFLVLPRWFKEVPVNDIKILDKDTWAVEVDELQARHPQIDPREILTTYGKLPKASFRINAGDKVQPWDGCPKALEDGLDQEDQDETNNGKPYIYIANLIEGSTIHAVYGKRRVEGRSAPVITQVPSRYYSWGDDVIVGEACTVVKINKQLSTYEGEGWEDDIWVTQTSPVGPNTAEIIEWLVNEYGDDLTVNAASFAEVNTLVDPFPSHFGLFSRPQLLSIIKDIAFQARCAVWLKGREVFIKYLPKKPSGVNTIGTNIIEEGTFTVTTTSTDELVTIFKAEWHPTYLDLDTSGNEVNRFVIAKENVSKYGVHEHEQHIFIYNQEPLVRKCLEFWITRWSNTWKKVSFNTHITGLSSETLDGVDLSLPAGLLGPTDITVVAEKVLYDSGNLNAQFEVWIPIRLGESDEYVYAWLQ
jgi:hypothetical protein